VAGNASAAGDFARHFGDAPRVLVVFRVSFAFAEAIRTCGSEEPPPATTPGDCGVILKIGLGIVNGTDGLGPEPSAWCEALDLEELVKSR
jgi:hypothetical protein